jgi:hypothetical protein
MFSFKSYITEAPRGAPKHPITIVDFILDGVVLKTYKYMTLVGLHQAKIQTWLASGSLPDGTAPYGQKRAVRVNGKLKTFKEGTEPLEVTEMHDDMSHIIANIEKRLAELETAVKNPTPKDTERSMDIRATKLDRLIGTLRSLKAEGASGKAYDFGKRLNQANTRRSLRYGNP